MLGMGMYLLMLTYSYYFFKSQYFSSFLFFFVYATKEKTNPKEKNAIPAVARSHFPFVLILLNTHKF